MAYESSVSEWLAAEVIILQQEQQQRQRTSAADTVAGQNTSAVGSHATSIRRQSLTSDKQTVEDVSSPFFFFKLFDLQPGSRRCFPFYVKIVSLVLSQPSPIARFSYDADSKS